MEVSILYELGYEIQRLANSPHKFLLFFTKTLKCEKELCQTAWNFANDAYLGCASLFYPPELLAAAAIYLAYKATTLPMIRLPWWVLSEYSFELVSEAAKAIYDVGCVPVSSILECKKTLEAAAAKAKTKDYSFEPNFDLMYKLTDRQILNRALDRISKHRESRSREVEKPDPRESDRRKKRDKSKTRRSRSKEARRSKHKSRKDSKSRSKHKRPDKSKRRRRGSSSSDRYSRVTQIPDFGDSRPKAEETGEGAEERQGGRQARAQKLEPQLPRSDRRLRQEERGEAGVARAAAP